MLKVWPQARLPEFGESSYCNVLRGLDVKKFNKQYPHKRARRALKPQSSFVACLRRYYLSRGSRKAENTPWGIAPGKLIQPKPLLYYTIPRFASFVDASEAFSYAAVLKAYQGKIVKVLQIKL